MLDIFLEIKKISFVKKVSNLSIGYPSPLTFCFFLCPLLDNKGIRINKNNTGLGANFKDGLSDKSKERLVMVKKFKGELEKKRINSRFVGIYALADSLILFSPPFGEGNLPEVDDEIEIISNYQLVIENLSLWNRFCKEKPWEKLPNKFLEAGRSRILGMLSNCPENVSEDFLERVFSGFALDGYLLKNEYFGKNPVILGVESPEVAVFQNAIFFKIEERIPVVQLF